MDIILINRFIMGWFDPIDKRLEHMAAYDAALNSERSTVTVRTMKPEHWGLL
jgi:hypothetical protein